MSLDLAKALKAPAAVEGWFVKVIIGGILLCIPIVNFIVMGYLVNYVKNLIDKNDSLPEYSDIGELFVTGFKGFIGALILAIPLLIILLIVGMVFSKAATLGMIISYILEILYGILALVMIANFSLDKKILSMVGFQRASLLIKDNTSSLISLVIFVVAANIIYGVLAIICSITVVGLILVPFLMYALMITTYNIIGQFAQNAPKLDEAKAQASEI